jgi:hypothetical protein
LVLGKKKKKKRCFTLEIVFWHTSRSVGGLILPDS